MGYNFPSIGRFWAIFLKEVKLIRRDTVTLTMMLGIPFMQVVLFGFAINSNPKHLPTAVVSPDISPYTRSALSSLESTEYFNIKYPNATEEEAMEYLSKGKVTFVINVPVDFTRDFIRGERPTILITADGTNPMAPVNAIAAARALPPFAMQREVEQGLPYLKNTPPPFDIISHIKYNPEAINSFNTVPGLMGVILTMTMVMITALAITREYEQGTMESLLVMPVRPMEVILGKLSPYILVGYIQQSLVILAGIVVFDVPKEGSILLLLVLTFPFIVANLAVGITFSTIAANQRQALQMAFFFFLPSILLSGFMFPFYGMPEWAQYIGAILPNTHFLRIARGILLKGNGFYEVYGEVGAIVVFMVVVLVIATFRYRRTLD